MRLHRMPLEVKVTTVLAHPADLRWPASLRHFCSRRQLGHCEDAQGLAPGQLVKGGRAAASVRRSAGCAHGAQRFGLQAPSDGAGFRRCFGAPSLAPTALPASPQTPSMSLPLPGPQWGNLRYASNVAFAVLLRAARLQPGSQVCGWRPLLLLAGQLLQPPWGPWDFQHHAGCAPPTALVCQSAAELQKRAAASLASRPGSLSRYPPTHLHTLSPKRPLTLLALSSLDCHLSSSPAAAHRSAGLCPLPSGLRPGLGWAQLRGGLGRQPAHAGAALPSCCCRCCCCAQVLAGRTGGTGFHR
jgi:hypothetical protein